MLSPKNLLLRVATSWLYPSAVGDILFGAVSLTFYAILINASEYQILLIIIMILITSVTMLAVSISAYSACFLFVDAGEVTKGIFDFFLTPSLFHGGNTSSRSSS